MLLEARLLWGSDTLGVRHLPPRTALRLGRTTLRLALVEDDAVAPPRALPDPRLAFGVVAAALLHVVLLAFMSHSREDRGLAEEGARETMQRMVTAAEVRANAEVAAVQESSRRQATARRGRIVRPHLDHLQ